MASKDESLPAAVKDGFSIMQTEDDNMSTWTGRRSDSSKSKKSNKFAISRSESELNDDTGDILEQFERVVSASEAAKVPTPPEMIYSTDGMIVKQLPWTKEDTKQVMDQVTFLQEDLLSQGIASADAKIWNEEVSELRRSLQDAIDGNNHAGILSRDDPLLKKLTNTMEGVNLVDLPKLVYLMKKSQIAGDCMEGRDVILLCGETGSGKTTTMHYLLGSTFEEIEVDGFMHLHPANFSDVAHSLFKTSYTREPTTRCLQAAMVRMNQEEVVLCDVPSYDVANCLEEDIVLGLGMVQAIRRAKSVRPVVVLSRDGMGNRFSNLPETMQVVSRLCNIKKAEDWDPFEYVFTKYDERHRSMLRKQFSALERCPPKLSNGYSQDIFEAFIQDIAIKTDPEANVVLPLEGNSEKLLSRLLAGPVVYPEDLCQAYASEFSLNQMELQMEVNIFNFRGLLLQEDYSSAIKNIKHMIDMATLFPDMQSYIRQAKEAILQQVAQVWVLVVRSIGKQDYHTALYRMEQLQTIANDFPDAVECSELGHEMLLQSITEPIANQMYKTSIHRMVELNKLHERFSEASGAVRLGLHAIQKNLVSLVEAKDYDAALRLAKELGREKENLPQVNQAAEHGFDLLRENLLELVTSENFDESIRMIKAISEVDLPAALETALHGLHSLREILTTMIDNDNFDDGIRLTKEVSKLGRDFVEANTCVRKILKTFRKRIDQMVQDGNFEQAGSLLRILSDLGEGLFEGDEYVQFAFDMAAQQVCELRMEVVNAFEAILKVKKDQKRYSQLLEFSLLSISMLLETEPMRLVCSEYFYKKTKEQGSEASTFKPNYLAILCTPKDCTSEAFCVAQVRHLVETIANELSEIQIENSSVDYLMKNRKTLLSTILRLRSAAKAYDDAPGGGLAASCYAATFSKFEALIGSILAMSEATFDSSIKMKEFECQAWFLAYLIQGFIKEVGHDQEKGADFQAMEDLDHRRVTLMLRFENEISDTMELLANYNFPEFQVTSTPNVAAFFQEVSLKDWEAPRQLLMSLSHSPELCKMMATMVSADEAKKSVGSLDKSIAGLFAGVIKYIEEAYSKVVRELQVKRISYTVGAQDAGKIKKDIEVILRELTAVHGWSDDSKSVFAPLLERLTEINGSLEILLAKLSGEIDISPAGFVMSIFSSAGPLACNCFGSNVEEFLTEVQSKLESPNPTPLESPNPTPLETLEETKEESSVGTSTIDLLPLD